jgi:anti-anti-sigma factor
VPRPGIRRLTCVRWIGERVDQASQGELFEVERQRAITKREVMLELQRALLPVGLPVLPDLSMAAGYRPADLADAAGGDWFDVVPMPGDAVALVVGDVVGHGATASAVMGQLRALTADRLQRGGDLEEVLRALDAFAAGSANARGSTVSLAIIDRPTGSVRYVVRGHPVPLVVAADGTTRYLTGSAGPPLALLSNQFHAADDRLAAGDTLVLYTDGAVVRPGRTIGLGLADLTSCVSEVVLGNKSGERNAAAAICAAITGAPNQDDVSVLAATMLTARPEPLAISVRASPEQLGEVRSRFAEWLDDFLADEDDRVALELSVVEAVTNSIEHAFTGPPGEVRVDAALDRAGTVDVRITDDGRWKPPQANPGFRGRGLVMMREFSDEFQLDIASAGTTVSLAKALSSPIIVDGDASWQAARAPSGLEFDVRDGPDGVIISLAGVLDSSSVDRLYARLLDVDRRGVLPVTIVLDDLTLLTSVGLRALYEHAGRLRAVHRPLRLIASPGSPARDVLTVSGLDQLVDVRP